MLADPVQAMLTKVAMYPHDKVPDRYSCLDSDWQKLLKFQEGCGVAEVVGLQPEGEGAPTSGEEEGEEGEEEAEHRPIKKVRSTLVWPPHPVVEVDALRCGRCEDCMRGDRLFKDLKGLLEQLEAASALVEEEVDVVRERVKLEKIRDSYNRYRGHVLRCAVQQNAYQAMLRRVKAERDFVFLVVDWKYVPYVSHAFEVCADSVHLVRLRCRVHMLAWSPGRVRGAAGTIGAVLSRCDCLLARMKILERRHREKMSEHFGKRGFLLHGVRCMSTLSYSHREFVMTFHSNNIFLSRKPRLPRMQYLLAFLHRSQ